MKSISNPAAFLRKQNQAGFIQAALLFGIALMTAVPVSYTHLTLPTNREV